ncbi:hypothetical protein [Pseudomonas sp. IsoF]|uniref:hypothetical protein n=1 Tax=Pseudomonas sp. IsoF TaxID=2821559 RepID=UPI0021C2DF48|nr:hypothetical protein [Pseudomonas sp. IsoF]
MSSLFPVLAGLLQALLLLAISHGQIQWNHHAAQAQGRVIWLTAQIQIMKEVAAVYQETQTFDRRRRAHFWIRNREAKLYEPGAIAEAKRQGITVKPMIERAS